MYADRESSFPFSVVAGESRVPQELESARLLAAPRDHRLVRELQLRRRLQGDTGRAFECRRLGVKGTGALTRGGLREASGGFTGEELRLLSQWRNGLASRYRCVCLSLSVYLDIQYACTYFIYVCVCICVWLFVYVCMYLYVCTYVCMNVHMQECMHLWIWVCMPISMHAFMYECMCVLVFKLVISLNLFIVSIYMNLYDLAFYKAWLDFNRIKLRLWITIPRHNEK